MRQRKTEGHTEEKTAGSEEIRGKEGGNNENNERDRKKGKKSKINKREKEMHNWKKRERRTPNKRKPRKDE